MSGTYRPPISIRPLREEDLPVADRLFRLAFGTFLGLPDPMAFAGDAEYVRSRWRADPEAGTNATESALESQTLYHLRVTLPSDLTQEAPNSIKVEVLGTEDIPALKLSQSPTAKMFGVAVGREASEGRPVLYMADWAGNLFTLRPAE
jgi:hypothetical protein